jgi:hypothetical protein
MSVLYNDLKFLGVGHSWVWGTLSGLGTTGNAYRREMYYRARSEYGLRWEFVGTTSGGDIPTPYHNGVSGQDSDALNTNIDTYLDNAFPKASSNNCVLLGPIGFADCLFEVPLATFKSNIDSIITKIHEHSALIKIFCITDPDTPDYTGFPSGQDLNDYAAEVENAYNDALAEGKNVYLIDANDTDALSVNIGADNIHPDWLGYEQFGEYITDQVAVNLGISAGTKTVLLRETFTDTTGTLLKNHPPDINNTNDVWHDTNDRFEINNNVAKGIGPNGYDTNIDIDQAVWAGQVKMYQSVNARVYTVLKSNSAGSSWIFMFLNTATNQLNLQNNGGLQATSDFVNVVDTWYTFNINIRGNSIKISDENNVTILHTSLPSTWANLTYMGISYYTPSTSYLDDLLVYDAMATPIGPSATTNAELMKKSLLRTQTTVEFYLNLGTSLDTAIDITKYVVNISDLNEKLSRSSGTGGVILPNLNIKLNNSRGYFNKNSGIFKNGHINNSLIKITTAYITDDDELFSDDFIYKGLIKYNSCEWDRSKYIFKATVIRVSNLVASEKIAAGILSNDSFSNIIYKMLNRRPFTTYLTIDQSNFSLGWDVAQTNRVSDMVNVTVKTVLDKIMLLTGSIYYVNYDDEFIIEPIIPTNPTAICTFRGQDIYSIYYEKYDWKNHYTGIKWDDSENTVQRVEMSYPDRELYQYDFTELVLSNQYVTDSTNRLTILNNLLSLYKYIKREIKIACKWNPDVIVNKYVILDVPQEGIIGDEFMIWNQDSWNDGKFWGFAQPGINFSSSELWRVINIKRDTEGTKMDVTLVQLYSDDET